MIDIRWNSFLTRSMLDTLPVKQAAIGFSDKDGI
jgi:hypothetical protein